MASTADAYHSAVKTIKTMAHTINVQSWMLMASAGSQVIDDTTVLILFDQKNCCDIVMVLRHTAELEQVLHL